MKTTINLNGDWKFTPVTDQKPNNNHNVIESDIPLYCHPKLNRRNWLDVQVPGCWEKISEKYSMYEGVAWYYKQVELENITEKTLVKLVFKGVNYRATVYVNGKYVGVHESGYTEFSFDISEYAVKGTNSIAVEVDNRAHITKWPNDWGYVVYSGIHRDCFIEVYNGNYIHDINIVSDYDVNSKNGILTLWGKAPKYEGNVTVTLGDEKYPVNCHDDLFCQKLKIENITPWSPDNPKLYDLTICIGDEVYKKTKIGFRNIRCKDNQILLNGDPITLNGACYLYDSPKYGLTMTKDQLEADLTKMKQANVNSIRTHYPMSDLFYDMCDEMGFTVWIEPNIYCSKPANNQVNTVFARKEMVDAAVSMTREMIKGARQYASVIIYGIGNECNTDHPEAYKFFEKIADITILEDNTRILGYASLFGQVGTIGNLVDVMGINSYFGWYDIIQTFDVEDKLAEGEIRKADVSAVHKMIEDTKAQLPDGTPILLTEFGADSTPGYIDDRCPVWSENHHANVVREYITASKEHDYVCGTYVFAFTDYGDPSKPNNGRWNGFNLKGMLSYDRQYKLPFYALKESYDKNNK